MGVVIPGDQLGRNRNTRRRLDLVTGQHPDLDARIPQKSNVLLTCIQHPPNTGAQGPSQGTRRQRQP